MFSNNNPPDFKINEVKDVETCLLILKKIKPENIQRISQLVFSPSALRYYDDKFLFEKQLSSIAECLFQNNFPIEFGLNFSSFAIESPNFAKVLAKIIKYSPSLSEINLKGCYIYYSLRQNLFREIVGGLHNSQCKKLDLNLSDHKNIGIELFAEAISKKTCLDNLSLNLSGCAIGDRGAAKLAEAICSGQAPANLSLNLSKNEITKEGAHALIVALEQLNTPYNLSINLGYNNIEPTLLKTISELLNKNNQQNLMHSMVVLHQGPISKKSIFKKLTDASLVSEIIDYLVPDTQTISHQKIELAAHPKLWPKTSSLFKRKCELIKDKKSQKQAGRCLVM